MASSATDDVTSGDDAQSAAVRGRAAKVLRALGTVLFALAIAALLALVAALTVVPGIAGAKVLNVLSGSMNPTIPPKSVVVVKPVNASSLKPGDVITFVERIDGGSLHGGPAGTYVTHRIVAVNHTDAGLTFTTKGDANNAADVDPVQAKAVVGKLWYHVPYVGDVRQWLFESPLGLYLMAGVLLAIGVYYLGRAFLSPPGGGDGSAGSSGGGSGGGSTARRRGFPRLAPKPKAVARTSGAVVLAGCVAACVAAYVSTTGNSGAWLHATATTPVSGITGDQVSGGPSPSEPAPSPTSTHGRGHGGTSDGQGGQQGQNGGQQGQNGGQQGQNGGLAAGSGGGLLGGPGGGYGGFGGSG